VVIRVASITSTPTVSGAFAVAVRASAGPTTDTASSAVTAG
jgi:hypothetical protein